MRYSSSEGKLQKGKKGASKKETGGQARGG
jgi:hypothetical protein